LLLYLEMNPAQLEKFQNDAKVARDEMAHFGLSQTTIEVVIRGDLQEVGTIFKLLVPHAGVGAVVGGGPTPKKKDRP
jgi:hypothetical protein